MKKMFRRIGSLLLAVNMVAWLAITSVSAAEMTTASMQETGMISGEETGDTSESATASDASENAAEPETETEESISTPADATEESDSVPVEVEATEVAFSGLSAEDRALMDQPQESLSLEDQLRWLELWQNHATASDALMAEEEQPQQYGRRALFSMNFSTLMSAREEVRKLLIATPGQWQDLAKKVNDPATHDTFASLYYQVTQDIDFDNAETTSIGINGYPFTGTLDGQSHTLRGINMVDYPENGASQAPISVTDGALVKDLTLENLSLSANSKVSAGLIGIANNTTVENVVLKQANFHFHHEVTSGGLIGSLTGTSVVRNCAVDVEQVSSLGVMGGLIGKTEGTATVDGCWVRLEQFYQSNTEERTCAGGIVGQTAGALQIEDCLVSNISYSSLTADYVGGILGNVASGGSASINRCIVAAYQLKGGNAAGIANGASAIENCVNISHNINITTSETEQTPLRIGNAATEKGNFAWGNMEFQRNNVGVNKPTSGDSGQGDTLTLTAEGWQANNAAWRWESAGYTAENGWQVPTTPGVPVLMALPSSLSQASSLPAWITPDSSYTYTIGTVKELQDFAAYINSGETVQMDGKTYPAYGTGVTFKLTADLDMAGVAWTPIGKDEAHPFRGTFTGAAMNDDNNKKTAKAYSIKNLNGPLFGVIEGGNANANNGANATVSSFALVNQTVNVPQGPAGGVACIAKNVYMNYCLVQGTVSGSGAVGGLIGKAEGIYLTTCAYTGASSYSNPTLQSSGGSVGGIVGESVGKTIRNCLVYNANLQTTGGNAVGGIVGTESMTVIDSNYSMAYELSNGGQTTEKVGRIVGVFTDDNSSGSVTDANGGWRGMQLNGSAISDNGTNRHQGIDLVYADGTLKMANGSAFNLYGDSWSTLVYDKKPKELATMPELYGSYFYNINGYAPTPLEGQTSAFPDYITKAPMSEAVNITSEEDLNALREGVNSGATLFKVGGATIDKAGAEGYSFILTKDIYLYNSWMPIGTKEHPFLASSLDGSGHSIENLKVDTNDVLPYAGLIGVMGSGMETGTGHYTIRNLTLTRCKICPETIDDVHFTAAGGLIGLVQSTIIVNVTGCSILGEDGNNDISDSKYVGGLVGQVAQNARLALNACRVDMASVGGIIPPFGNVDDSYSYAAGGLVGRAEPGSYVGIDGSAFTGSVDSTATYIGGLVGGGDNAEVLIKNSYAYAKMISLQTFSGKLYVGGILGAGNEYSKVYNCLAWGDISYGGLNAGLDYLGGIAGSSAPSVQNCVALQNSLTGPKAAQLQPGNAAVGSANNLAFSGSTSKGEKQGTQIYKKDGIWYSDAACTQRLTWDGVLNADDPDIGDAPKVWTFTTQAYRLPKLPVMPAYPQTVFSLPVMLSSTTFKIIRPQTYTGQPITPTLVPAYGIGPLTAGQDYTVVYSNNTEVGTATVTVTALESGNCIGSTQLSYQINRCPVTVQANAAAKKYGQADPTLTYTADGLVAGETLNGMLTRAKGEDAGTYGILQGSLTDSANPNYKITYSGADLTVQKADVTLNAWLDNQTPAPGDLVKMYITYKNADADTLTEGTVQPDAAALNVDGTAALTLTTGVTKGADGVLYAVYKVGDSAADGTAIDWTVKSAAQANYNAGGQVAMKLVVHTPVVPPTPVVTSGNSDSGDGGHTLNNSGAEYNDPVKGRFNSVTGIITGSGSGYSKWISITDPQTKTVTWKLQYVNGANAAGVWEKVNGKWYKFDASGSMQTGWVHDNGKWYYLDPVNGDMKVGYLQAFDGYYYYFRPDGSMAVGDVIIDGVLHHFNSELPPGPTYDRDPVTGEWKPNGSNAIPFGAEMK